MATVRLKIDGQKGNITFRAFLTCLQNEIRILKDIDSGVSGQADGSLDWVVRDLFIHSIEVIAESRSRLENKNYGPEVASLYVNGLSQIEHEGSTPPYFSETAMKSAKKLLKVIGRDGAVGIEVSTMESAPVKLSSRGAVNVEQLLPARYSSVGSIEGKIEMISIHGKPKFILYHSRTKKAVTCRFDQTRWLEKVKDNLGRRVNVSGELVSNARGEPLRIDIDDIRPFRDEMELPRASELTGIDPDFTEGVETVEYLRRSRLG